MRGTVYVVAVQADPWPSDQLHPQVGHQVQLQRGPPEGHLLRVKVLRSRKELEDGQVHGGSASPQTEEGQGQTGGNSTQEEEQVCGVAQSAEIAYGNYFLQFE